MSEAHHDLATEFPKFKDIIHKLKTSDSHFKGLLDRYYDLNKAVHRSEQRIDLLSELEEEQLRKKRLHVKDELYSLLVKAAA